MTKLSTKNNIDNCNQQSLRILNRDKSFALVHSIRTDWLCQTDMTGCSGYSCIKKRDKSDKYWCILASTDECNINKNNKF